MKKILKRGAVMLLALSTANFLLGVLGPTATPLAGRAPSSATGRSVPQHIESNTHWQLFFSFCTYLCSVVRGMRVLRKAIDQFHASPIELAR